jgi:LacI family transcriptional regulator
MNMSLYQDFKVIWLIGLGMSGLDAEIRRGLMLYRGKSKKWLFHDLGHSVEAIQDTFSQHSNRQCDGFIGHVGSPEIEHLLRKTGKPVINLSGVYPVPEWETHRIDGEAIGRMAADYYLSRGHRNFIFFGPGKFKYAEERWKGFYEGLKGKADFLARIQERELEIFFPDASKETPVSKVERLKEMPKPLAGFCAWDQYAMTLCDYIHFEIHVPEELSLLGVDNNEVVCGMSVIPISSIALPAARLGYLAAEHLDCLLEGLPVPELQVLQPERVVERASTDLVAMEDPIVAKALALMRHHAADRTTIEEIADKLPISRRGFTDRFKDAVGRTAREELFRIRVELAKERLLTTNQTMYQIAVECGFTDPESLAKHFRKWAGMSPSGFRKQHRV